MRHSATSLKTWETCPRLYKAKYVDRILPYVQHPAAVRGEEIHKQLEDAVASGVPPYDVWTPNGLIPTLHKQNAVVETEVAVTKDLEPTTFSSDDAWLRGKIDVLVMGRNHALVLDWKTGKVRPDKTQADMYNALVRIIQDDADLRIDFRLVYVDQKQVVKLDRDAKAVDRTVRLAEKVEADRDYLPVPSWKCRFCEFTACRFNETRE